MVGRRATAAPEPTRCISRARYLIVSVAAAVLSLHASGAGADPQSTSGPLSQASSRKGKAGLDTITVEAKRERKAIERQVNAFVSAVIAHSFSDTESLARWHTPI